MRIFLSFCFLFSFQAYACDFKSDVKSVVSLSGPATVLLKEMGLLLHPKFQGISVFHPIGEKEFSGKIYPGGVFFSQSSLSSLSGSVVFYDESRELNRVFAPLSSVVSREIKTRNLTPHEAVEKTLFTLEGFLQGCESQISNVQKKVKNLEEKILLRVPQNLSVVFYLGEFKGDRAPELVIAQDGIVKWLVQKKKIKTYPSELAYVNWSARIMNALPKKTMHVGVKDSARDLIKEIKKSPRGMTLIYPGSLVPGLSQLEAFLYWSEVTF